MTATTLTIATTREELDRAALDAHAAFLAAAGATPSTRAGWLDALARALRENAAELVQLGMADTNLAEARLQGELKRSAFQLELFAEEVRTGVVLDAVIDHADPEWGMGPRPDIRRVNVPLGVVGVFGASNFPFAFSVMGGDSASALAAGCAVLHKVHSGHRTLALRTAEIAVEALRNAGAPEGLFGVVDGREAAEALVDHPLVKAIGFTGSTAGGRALFNRASARAEPIPFYGELGSINPVFVLPEAWSSRSADILAGYAGSFTMGMGQFCTKPGVLFVPDSATEEQLRGALSPALEKAPLGKLLTPGLRDSFGQARDGLAGIDGVTTLIPGSDDEVPSPTVLLTDAAAVKADPEILRQEMFGPATVVVRYSSPEELPGLAGLMEGQLTATIHADDADQAGDLLDTLTGIAGRVLWNGWPTGVTVSYAQQHGGPYPATTAPGTTSVGTAAVGRFTRPVAYQDVPDQALPPALREANPWGIRRRVDGRFEEAQSVSREGAR
ncbi:NADP-dependent aldehyde dehydrogenase [Arthrobacter subterraneus]|uniref:NADP-dependent aldehyde dehydrogenase n=1 Tax=Arthrobacter subterraneus TaxID=335973 RepID=A0A1G8KY15_9MICC|nr:aldehyde dehydrogenase (NADP(+)) [Arthrobacter subterraneus]SDI48263.1 NADP-dependent aldehyde dehydrogenase [Arthrobacter subterraneus]